jgi:hypothetical protein
MVSPNYGFEKRKKELAKKEKQRQKQQQKRTAQTERSSDEVSVPPPNELNVDKS